MPDLDGIQLLKSVREHDLDVPVILVTGAPDIATAQSAITHGVFRYLAKPVDVQVLKDVLKQAVDLHRLVRIKREAFALLGRDGRHFGDPAALQARFATAMETLWIAYQPIVRAKDRSLFGYEALLRTGSPGLPHPGAVIDAAEKLGKLPDLGRRIRASATEPFRAAPSERVSSSISTPTICPTKSSSRRSRPSAVSPTASSSRSPSARPSARCQDARERVARLRELGFRIAIDDLGAGYAGLTSFASLEPEVVKLDMTLVRDVHKPE